MDDLTAFLRDLRKRGFIIKQAKRRGHRKILTSDGRLVTIAPPTSCSRAGLADLKSQIRQWERQQAEGADR